MTRWFMVSINSVSRDRCDNVAKFGASIIVKSLKPVHFSFEFGHKHEAYSGRAGFVMAVVFSA